MTKILIKRGTATQWSNSTTALLAGELGLDTTNNLLKVGNGISLWNSLSEITLTSTQINELAQDAVALSLNHSDHSNILVTYNDSSNKIILSSGPDIVTFSDLGNSLGDYIPLSYYGNADGVATLDENSLIPDTQIPSTIARDSELFSGSYNDLTDKPTIPSLTGYATEAYVGTAVSNLVDSAPAVLDTLNELAAALGDDANFATTVTNSIATKAPIASPTFTGTVTIPAGSAITGVPYLATANTFTASQSITSTNSSTVGLIVKGAASQTANLQEWQDSAGNVLASISPSLSSVVTLKFTEAHSFKINWGSRDIFSTASGHLTVTPYDDSRKVLVVKGYSAQTANLQEWQNSAGTVLANIGPSGILSASNVAATSDVYAFYGRLAANHQGTFLGQITGVAGSASTIGLVVKGAASQTANLTEWQDNTGTVLTRVRSDGMIFSPKAFGTRLFAGSEPADWTNYSLYSYSSSASLVTLGIQGNASQTADLTQWKNGSGTVIAKVDASGAMFTATASVGTDTTQVATTAFVKTAVDNDNLNIYITDSGPSRTLSGNDIYKIIEMTSSSSTTITIPSDPSDTTFPVGSWIEVRQMGSGQVTVSATSPATVVATDNQFKTRVQYSSILLEKRAPNAWYLAGDTTA